MCLANLAVSAWIKFDANRSAAIVVSVIMAAALAAFWLLQSRCDAPAGLPLALALTACTFPITREGVLPYCC